MLLLLNEFLIKLFFRLVHNPTTWLPPDTSCRPSRNRTKTTMVLMIWNPTKTLTTKIALGKRFLSGPRVPSSEQLCSSSVTWDRTWTCCSSPWRCRTFLPCSPSKGKGKWSGSQIAGLPLVSDWSKSYSFLPPIWLAGSSNGQAARSGTNLPRVSSTARSDSNGS